MNFELNNNQRLYFGLEPIKKNWEKVSLKGDTYRKESILYFEGDVIKRHIISNETQYREVQYNEPTRSREFLLPKTGKGKEKKLTGSVLESRLPTGVYCQIDSHGRILISNFTTQTTFYDSFWEHSNYNKIKSTNELVEEFIDTCSEGYMSEIDAFKSAKRRNIKFKPGDFFAFKINRTEYGFGRILLDINDLKERKLIPADHGLAFLMAKAVLIKIYARISDNKNIDLIELEKFASLPSDYMMDNAIFYGEYEIIGHRNLREDEFDFPMSYGRHINLSDFSVFLQWGLINIKLPTTTFLKYISADNPLAKENEPLRNIYNPYGYYGVGFRHKYDGAAIKKAISNNGRYNFDDSIYKSDFDLRNPKNEEIREELMRTFGLNLLLDYDKNCILTKTISMDDLLKKI